MKKAVAPDEFGTELGRRIREMREARELTQKQLSLMLGKAIETISNMERGRNLISLITLQHLGEIFEVPLTRFFDDAAAPGVDPAKGSKYAATIINSLKTLSESDQEIVAGLITVLEGRAGRSEPEKKVYRARKSRRQG